MITHTISWSELIRSICYLLACIFTSKIFINSSWDLFVLKIKRINSIREYAAVTTVVCFGVFVYINFVLLVASINSMTIPSPNHQLGVQVVNSVLYISVSLASCISSFMINKRRKEIRHKIAELENFDT